MDQFHLGTVGALRALPSPSLGGGPEATATRLGAVHRSLGGRVTLDRLAVKRTWTLTWPYLDPDTHAYLDALHHGLVAGPVWLLDPQRRNLLHPRVAATGSFTRTTDGFTPSAGTLAWTVTVPDPGIALAGGLRWSVPAAGGLCTAEGCPVIGERTLRLSAWVASTVVPVRLMAAFYDRADTLVGLVESTNDITTPPTGTRRWLAITPPASAATARVGISASTTTGGGAVATTAWQLEDAPAITAWAPGGGTAHVVIDALTAAYPIPGAWATTLTLLEV